MNGNVTVGLGVEDHGVGVTGVMGTSGVAVDSGLPALETGLAGDSSGAGVGLIREEELTEGSEPSGVAMNDGSGRWAPGSFVGMPEVGFGTDEGSDAGGMAGSPVGESVIPGRNGV